MLVASAHEELDELINEQQGDGSGDANPPLVPAQGGQAKEALQEAELGRQDGYQQRHAIELQLVSITDNVPVKGGLGLAANAESPGDAE